MTDFRFLDRAQVDELLTFDRLRRALETALIRQSSGRADVPPRIAAVGPHGLLATMPGHLDGVGMAAKVVSVFPGSVPSHQGVIVVVDADSGALVSIMDAEVITERRTAMTAAIAADALARPDARILAIAGAGSQGHAHLHAFGDLRRWEEIRIVSRTRNKATILASEARSTFGADVSINEFDHFETAVRGADVVALCTHSGDPVIRSDWVATGTHVSSVGSLAELPVDLVETGLLVVDQLGAITDAPPAGAVELQGLDATDAVELGALIVDDVTLARLGRSDPRQITVYKSTGHAVQDIAAAHVVLDAAIEAGVGLVIDS